ncbi:hypothetical protein EDC01DRAFT_426034 [Geopyxis carbonaria]|nr:hypothetical protein EDC01DRAFT_426034 [Geopyxis carbonaria]
MAVPPSPATSVPVNSAPTSVPTGPKEDNLSCQWSGCSERFETAEDLYNHLCDIHVGRKSTNNLCLTCAWGTCRTTTVKRDHITSHIRVHVPLKPHKCEFCGKAFKRPQDLKKHVKTHADDSVLLRSPEPDGTGRRQSGAAVSNSFFTETVSLEYEDSCKLWQGNQLHQYTTSAAMQPLAATAAQAYYGLGTYYPNNTGQNQVYYYQQHPQAAGQEAIAQAASAAAAHNEKKRSFDGVDQFFEDAKRHKLQPVYDGAMAQRLSALQFVPSTTGEGVDFNGHTTTVTAPPTTSAGQPFTLPSLRTKQDLIDADNFLTQLSANVYENSNGQQFPFRGNQAQSPHTPTQQQAQQHHDGAPAAQMGQNQAGTPALTPPTSNYTASASPATHHTTPPTVSPQASTASMYPSLPAVVTSSDVGNGYPAPVSAAPATSLGSTFESGERRRYSVGVLQRSKDVDMANYTDDQGNSEEQGGDPTKEISSSLIDPSLGALEGPPEKIPLERDSGIIMNLHSYVKSLLKEEEERESKQADQEGEPQQQDAPVDEDHQMIDAGNTDGSEAVKHGEEPTDAQALYPILKAVAAC